LSLVAMLCLLLLLLLLLLLRWSCLILPRMIKADD
jgi:hypothetical protein